VNDEKKGKKYLLPDGSSLSLSQDLCNEAPEILFKPEKVGLEYQGLPELLMTSIKNCDIDLRGVLLQNVVLAGGCTAFENFSERLHTHLKTESKTKIKLIAPKNRKTTCWIGGSTLSSLKSFGSMWITNDEYKSGDKSVVFTKGMN